MTSTEGLAEASSPARSKACRPSGKSRSAAAAVPNSNHKLRMPGKRSSICDTPQVRRRRAGQQLLLRPLPAGHLPGDFSILARSGGEPGGVEPLISPAITGRNSIPLAPRVNRILNHQFPIVCIAETSPKAEKRQKK